MTMIDNIVGVRNYIGEIIEEHTPLSRHAFDLDYIICECVVYDYDSEEFLISSDEDLIISSIYGNALADMTVRVDDDNTIYIIGYEGNIVQEFSDYGDKDFLSVMDVVNTVNTSDYYRVVDYPSSLNTLTVSAYQK